MLNYSNLDMKKHHVLNDEVLVIACIQGNQKAITRLVEKWHIVFCKVAYGYVKDADVAKDIAQESWKVIFNKLETIKEPCKFKAWAVSIVSRKAIDFLRMQKRREATLKELYEEKEIQQIEDNLAIDYKLVLKKEIDRLPEDQQTVIRLFYVQELTLKEISTYLEISVGTAKSRLFHARERLKKVIKTYKL